MLGADRCLLAIRCALPDHSRLQHIADPTRALPLDEAVGLDLDALIASKYELIVLRPALHDAELQRAFAALVADTRASCEDNWDTPETPAHVLPTSLAFCVGVDSMLFNAPSNLALPRTPLHRWGAPVHVLHARSQTLGRCGRSRPTWSRCWRPRRPT